MGTMLTHKGQGKAVVAPLEMDFYFFFFLSFPCFILEKMWVINIQEERERKLLYSFFSFLFSKVFSEFWVNVLLLVYFPRAHLYQCHLPRRQRRKDLEERRGDALRT